VFLLVLAYPGSPGPKAIKRLLLFVLLLCTVLRGRSIVRLGLLSNCPLQHSVCSCNKDIIIITVVCRPVTLVVAKCWDPAAKSYLSPRQEPVRPIDPSAWVAHTEAVRAVYGRLGLPPSVAGVAASNAPAYMPSVPESSCMCWLVISYILYCLHN